MKYCSNGTDFTQIWYDDGINHCFLNTVTSGLLFLFILVWVSIQGRVFRKYSTHVKKKYVKTNCWTVLQIFLTLMLMIESASHIVTQDLTKGNSEVRGVDILTFLCLFLAWSGTLRLLSLERKHLLRCSRPRRGHGRVLLAFYALAFLRENLAFISWWSQSWWWDHSR